MIRNRICSLSGMQITRVVFISVLLSFSIAFVAVSQTVSNSVSAIADGIADTGSLGFDQDAQYNRFIKLNSIATDDELVALTDHESPSVRGYAFWALAKRNYSELRAIFIDHLDDKAPVLQKNGCMVGNESVISFMRQVVTPYMYDPDCKKLDDNTRALVK